MKIYKIFILIPIAITLFVLFLPTRSLTHLIFAEQTSNLWNYQCIDTMKISRDSARALMHDAKADVLITKQITLIKNTGANCVAIDTPYDDEFLPYLEKWVHIARENKLSIWFRGNWSGWEGWFDYPKINPQQHLEKTNTFILSHPALFQDNDIFTLAPEAENGWSDSGLQYSDFDNFRKFLRDEYTVCNSSFSQIGKHIKCNWLSMSGGVAKEIINQSTADSLGKTITLDHYVSSTDDMNDIINYFHDTFQTGVVIGEFGAPIPDINGDLTEKQQAEFVDKIFFTLYKYRRIVQGVNYWTLTDSTTALFNPNGSPRMVVSVIHKYFSPMSVRGVVTDSLGVGLSDVHIKTTDGVQDVVTDNGGTFMLTLPSEDTDISIAKSDYISAHLHISPSDRKPNLKVSINPVHPDFWYKVRLFFTKLI